MSEISISDLVDKLVPNTTPVSFTEFVMSKEYCNTNGIYPFWIEAFESMIKEKGLVAELIMDGSLGGGKCVSGDTYVLTHEGIRRIDSLVEHREPDTSQPACMDLLVEGRTERTSHTYYSGFKKALHLKFSDGGELKCSPHHPLKRFNGESFDWVKAEDLINGESFVKMDYTSPLSIPQFTEGYKIGILSTAVRTNNEYFLKDVGHLLDNLIGVYGLHLEENELGFFKGPLSDISGPYFGLDDAYVLTLSLQNQIGFLLGLLDVRALVNFDCVILPGRDLNLNLYKSILNAFGIRAYIALDEGVSTLTIPIRIDFHQATCLSSAIVHKFYGTTYEQEHITTLNGKLPEGLPELGNSMASILEFKQHFPNLDHIELTHESSITKLVSVEEIGCELFDLTNPHSHSYRANGLVVHNTTLASFWVAYRVYNLFLNDNLRKDLKILDTSTLYILYFSVSLSQARKSGFKQLINIIDSCKWFKERHPRDESIDSVIRFPKKNFEINWASGEGHQLSLDVIGFILDEANFREGVGKGVSSEYLEVARLYQQLMDRQISRFASLKGSMAFSVLVSSASYESSFVETRKNKVKDHVRTGNITAVAYKIKPENYSKETFEVFIGTGTQPPEIIRNPEHKYSIVKGSGLQEFPDKYNELFIQVPESLKDTYKTSLRLALQNHSGVSTRSSGRLVSNVTLLTENLFIPTKPWFPFISVTLSNKDEVTLFEFLLQDNIEYADRPHAAHLDLSITGDTGGLTFYRNDSVDDKNKFYHHVCTIAIEPPPFPAETSIQKVEDFMVDISQLINLQCFSSDQYQSKQIRQNLNTRLGLEDSRFSIDSSDQFYLHFMNLLVGKQTNLQDIEKIKNEFINALHDLKKRRVIKEDGETDDLMQSVVGAAFGCSVYTNVDTLPDVKRNLVGNNSVKKALGRLGYK